MVYAVAILANAGNGKTTVAKFLHDRYDVEIVSLASPLKAFAKAVMNFTDKQLYGTQAEKERIDPRYGMSARTFVKKAGTEGLRECFWPTIHVDGLMRTLEREESDEFDQMYCVDDCRFLNEAAAFGEVNASIEKPHRTAVIKLVCTDAPPVDLSHRSEAEIDLVPPEHIAATVVSSRIQGLDHLYSEIEKAFERAPRLAPFRRLLREGAARVGIRHLTRETEAVGGYDCEVTTGRTQSVTPNVGNAAGVPGSYWAGVPCLYDKAEECPDIDCSHNVKETA